MDRDEPEPTLSAPPHGEMGAFHGGTGRPLVWGLADIRLVARRLAG